MHTAYCTLLTSFRDVVDQIKVKQGKSTYSLLHLCEHLLSPLWQKWECPPRELLSSFLTPLCHHWGPAMMPWRELDMKLSPLKHFFFYLPPPHPPKKLLKLLTSLLYSESFTCLKIGFIQFFLNYMHTNMIRNTTCIRTVANICLTWHLINLIISPGLIWSFFFIW